MSDPNDMRQAVDAYHHAWTHGGDFSAVPYADDIRVTGTLESLEGAQEFLALAARWAPAVKDMRLLHQVAEGEKVFSLYDLTLDLPIDDIRVAELICFRDGRIQSVDAVYDARQLVEVLGR